MTGKKALAGRIRALLPVIGSLKIRFTIESAFILIIIIDEKVVKIKANFLADWNIYLYNNLFDYNYSM